MNPAQLLIIEDDLSQVILLQGALKGENYSITNIEDGEDAYQYLLTTTQPPDLILIDYHLPRLDGITLMELLKEKNINLNYIFFTADYSIETAIRSVNAGALEFIPKDGRFVKNIPKIIKKILQNILAKSEKELIEKALKKSEDRFKLIMEATHEGIFEYDFRENNHFLNPNNAIILGYHEDELPQTYNEWMGLIHPEDVNLFNNKIKEHLINKTPYYEVELRVRAKNLEYKWLQERGIVVEVDSNNQPLKIIGSRSDITERKTSEALLKQAYEELMKSEEEKKIILNNSLHSFILMSPTGQIITFNKVASHQNIVMKNKILEPNLSVFDFISPSDKVKFVEEFNKTLSSGTTFWESNMEHANEIYWFENTLVPIYISKDKIKYICWISGDISERKSIEKKIMNTIIETEEKERKRFSEDLHDGLGSLLSTIKIYINTLHSENIEPEKRNQMVELTNDLINQAIQNSREIANNISPSIITRFGLASALHSFCDKIQMAEKLNIDLQTKEYTNAISKEAEISIYRIITELVNNTLKHSGANDISIQLISENKNIHLVYSDNGKGFDVSETLKSNTNKGHGIQNIFSRISSLNGKYTFESNEKQGFKMNIELIP